MENHNLNMAEFALVNAIADEAHFVPYRPEICRAIGGNTTDTLFLARIAYWAKKEKWQEFYKFHKPCEHERYRPGDSWEEELGISEKSIRGSLSRIGFKLGNAARKAIASEMGMDKDRPEVAAEFDRRASRALVVYYTDTDRVTRYRLNLVVYSRLLKVAFENDLREVTKPTLGNFSETSPREVTRKPTEGQLSPTKKTTKRTTEKTGKEESLQLSLQAKRELHPHLFEEAVDKPLSFEDLRIITPEWIRDAVDYVRVKFKPGGLTAPKMELMNEYIPVVRMMNTILKDGCCIKEPSDLKMLWSRWRRGSKEATMPDSRFLDYCRFAVLCPEMRDPYEWSTVKQWLAWAAEDEADPEKSVMRNNHMPFVNEEYGI